MGISLWMDDLNLHLSADELLTELGWLRRLARSLVGGVGAEDDLVQETWLAATRVAGGVSRPWLVATLRRLAARWHRGESRLKRRERAAAPGEAVDMDSMLERNELLGLVLGELRSVDEPFRSALILVYQEGLTVRDAAARLGVPEDTLRWRRREGLQRLRAQLDRGTSRDWRAGLVPLFAPHTIALTQAGAALSAPGHAMTLVGGFLMTWKVTSAVLIACVATFFALSGDDREQELLPELAVSGPDSTPGNPNLGALAPVAQEDARHAAATELPHAPVKPKAVSASPVLMTEPVTGPTLVVTATGPSRRPIEGARIWLGDTPDPVDAFWVTDADGIAVLPLPKSTSTTLSGMTESLYASIPLHIKSAGGEARLRLLPDADVSVLMVDQAGAPVPDVPVALIVKARLEHTGSEQPRDNLAFHPRARTDAEGLALVRHVPHFVRYGKKRGRYWIGPAVLLAQRSDVIMVGGELPTEPVRIVLPPVGPMDLRVLDREGARNRSATRARVMIDPSPGLSRDVPQLLEEARFSSLGIVDVNLIDGAGRLPMVGLGLQLLAEAREVEPTGSTFGLGTGPVSVSEAGELRLEPQDRGIWITGVARDTEGSLLTNQELSGSVQFVWKRVGNQSFGFELVTDAVGGFRVHIDEEARVKWDGPAQRTLNLTRIGDSPDVMSAVQCPLPERLSNGDNDLGVLTLEDRIPLLAGQATTKDGVPVELGWISVRVNSQVDPNYRRMIHGLRRIVEPGSFAIYGDPIELDPERSEVLMIGLNPQGFPGLERAVTQGEQDLRFVFDEPGFLSGRVLLRSDESYQDYWVTFSSRDATGKRETSLPVDLARNGRFTLEGLRLRVGDIEVRDTATKTLLARVQDVSPSPDPDGVEPRLAEIDLRAKVHEYALEVTDAEGASIRGAHLDSPLLPGQSDSFGSGRFRWRAAAPLIEGRIYAPGYLSQAITLSPGDSGRVVVLERGPEVLVRPMPAIALPDGATVQVRLVGGDTYEEVRLRAVGDGHYSGFVSGAGTYRVRGLILQRGKQLAELPFSSEPVATVLVEGTSTTQSFEVPFDVGRFEASVTGR